MSYPDLPNNRLIVNGEDLALKYGLILVDGYTLDPPEPKTYTVDIPGGDGVIDLTDTLLGDTAYKNRKIELEFYLIDIGSYEDIMTVINRTYHGKSFDFKFTMDPDYTYHGRFVISDQKQNMYANGLVGYFKLTIDADPYKYLQDPVYHINAVGGKTVQFESGRKRVRPTIETDGFLKVIYNNKLYTLPQGSWTINDILFKEGVNEVYFNSYDVKNLTWGQLKNMETTWGAFKKTKLYEWYKSNGEGAYVIERWLDEESKTWNDLSEKTWTDLVYMANATEQIKDVYVKYKVGDL
jgi:phage-related protein